MSAKSLSGKGKKAWDRLEAIDEQVKGVLSRLQEAQTTLSRITSEVKGDKENEAREKVAELENKQDNTIRKSRSAIKGMPTRIEFSSYGLHFYIDFTVTASDRESLVNIEGCIVYGVTRPLCFAECILPEGRTKEWAGCDRITRCDRFEDKPLVQFSVNRDGIIRSSDGLDDQWRILDTAGKDDATVSVNNEAENEMIVQDLHYRALDHIWKDALDWTNENVLP